MKYLFAIFVFLLSHNGFCINETDIQPFSPDMSTSQPLFILAGSNTVGARLAPEWAKAYLEKKGAVGVTVKSLETENEFRVQGYFQATTVYIDIHAHGSSTGFRALKNSTADIAMASRQIKLVERQDLQSLGDLTHSASEHVVAIDGLAIIVNSSNSISSISVEDIGRIFTGKVRNWRELGGPDWDVNVYARDENSGTWDTFKSLVLKKAGALVSDAKRFESNDELSSQVSNDIGAIGFVGLASVNQAKALSVYEGKTTPLAPEPLYIATEDYPLARRLFLYTPEQPSSIYVEEFVRFTQNTIGQSLVDEVGFVSQNPIQVEVADAPNAPKVYQNLIADGKRLSVNFRFRPGSAELDNKAKQDALRLAKYFRLTQNAQKRVQLVGFNHQERSAKAASALSKLRATAVKLELFKYGVEAEPVVAFGDNKLVASAGAVNAKAKNDRVEVWVYGDADTVTGAPQISSSVVTP